MVVNDGEMEFSNTNVLDDFAFDFSGQHRHSPPHTSTSNVRGTLGLGSPSTSSDASSFTPSFECSVPSWQWENPDQSIGTPSNDFPSSSCSTLTDSPPRTADYFQGLGLVCPSYSQTRVPSETSSDHSTATDSDLSALLSIASQDNAPAYSDFNFAPRVEAGDLSFILPPDVDQANYFSPEIQPASYDFQSPTPITSAFLDLITSSIPDQLPSAGSEFDPKFAPSFSLSTAGWSQSLLDNASSTANSMPLNLDAFTGSSTTGLAGGSDYLKLDDYLPEMDQIFATYEAEGGGYEFVVPEPASSW